MRQLKSNWDKCLPVLDLVVFLLIQKEEPVAWHQSRVIGVIFSNFLIKRKEILLVSGEVIYQSLSCPTGFYCMYFLLKSILLHKQWTVSFVPGRSSYSIYCFSYINLFNMDTFSKIRTDRKYFSVPESQTVTL